MSYTILIQSEAIEDIKDAFEWYEDQRSGLGYELLEEIEFCYENLIINPERYSFINELYRRIKTRRFPYILIYDIDDNVININSFRHVKRKPK